MCARSGQQGRARGVLIVCCDGLTGLPEAVEATWPDSMVQTCVVHLIRASMRFVAYGDRKGVAAALRPSLHRPRRGGRPTGPGRLPPVRPGPTSTPRRRRARERAWERNTAFLAFPPALRRVTSAPPTRSSR